MWLRARLAALVLLNDCRGIAATEFAMVVPIMLMVFFGTVEVQSGVATYRKATLIARTLSDLAAQAAPPPSSVNSPYATLLDSDLQNIFTAGIALITPYPQTPLKVQLSEIYVDSNLVAKIQWSKAATIGAGATQATLTTSTRSAGDTITIPPALLVRQTYLTFGEVSYLYTPVGIGYVMKSNVTLSDVSYTRPRLVVCIVYNNQPALVSGQCPAT